MNTFEKLKRRTGFSCLVSLLKQLHITIDPLYNRHKDFLKVVRLFYVRDFLCLKQCQNGYFRHVCNYFGNTYGEEIETAWNSGFVYNKNCAVYNNEDLSLSLIGLCNLANWVIKL